MFMIRAVLAATLSSVYGIYSGFELCENAALPGREEYLDSEKYQLKERDWNAPGNIKELITQLNRIRRENRALHFYDNLRFHPVDNEAILFYGKMTPARDNIILVVVNLDPLYTQSGYVDVPIEQFGEIEGDSLRSARSPDRRALSLARAAQLRRAGSRRPAGAYLPGAAVVRF